MALNTIHTALMHKVTVEGVTSYAKLVCIKDYPDFGGIPSALETTTLCDEQQTFIEGVKSGEQMTFTANYTKADYDAIVALKGVEQEMAIYFGETGADGKFGFNALVSVSVIGKGVDEVREMSVIVTPTTKIQEIAD